jgi:hypothetical protein
MRDEQQVSTRITNFTFPIPLNINSPLNNIFSNSSSSSPSKIILNYNNQDVDQQPQIRTPQSVENPCSVDTIKRDSTKIVNQAFTININNTNIKAASYEDLTNISEDDNEESFQHQHQQQLIK